MTNVGPPPLYGDEREMLISFLDVQRDTLLWKLEGLSEEQLTLVHQPSGMCLLGLLKHLIRVEGIWFQHRLKGEELNGLPNDDTGWVPAPSENSTVLLEQFESAWRTSNAIARELELDTRAMITSERFGAVSLQWVLLHMIEEYARHCGHADFLRESIDGRTGYTRFIQ